MKQKNQLLENLVNSEFSVMGECAVSLLLTKLELINIELRMKLNRNVIQVKTGRIKTYESTVKKLKKKGLELDFAVAAEQLNDLIGVRAVCSYIDDIYKVKERLTGQKDIHILKEKDYIREPKKSGYRSLHLIVEIPIEFQGETKWMKMELQLRTAAMDYWANLDHQLRYKKAGREAETIDDELRMCAQEVENLDRKMLEIRKKIERI